jgi:hypothetical protein
LRQSIAEYLIMASFGALFFGRFQNTCQHSISPKRQVHSSLAMPTRAATTSIELVKIGKRNQ